MLILDIAFILVSLTACVYCIVLSRRLRALQDTRDGLGGTITALSQSLAQLSQTSRGMRAEVAQSATTLSARIDDAREMIGALERTKTEIERSPLLEVRDLLDDARTQTADLEEAVETAKDRILDLTILLKRSESASAKLRFNDPDRTLIRDMIAEAKG